VGQQATVLWYVTNLATQFDGIQLGGIHSIYENLPSVRDDQSVEGAKKSALSGAAFSNEDYTLGALDLNRHIVQRYDRAKAL